MSASLASFAPSLTAHFPALAAFALRGAWESPLLAGFTAGLFRFLPGLSPRARTALAGAAIVLAVLLPCCATGAPAPGQTGGPGLPMVALPAGAAGLVCALWFALSLARFVRLGVSAVSLRRLLRSAQAASPAVLAAYVRLAEGRARRARLLVADGLAAPSACGLLRPAILLPRGLPEALAPEDLQAILRHEAAHLRAGDDWLALALGFLRAALPLSLGLGPLARRLLLARETACDQAALAGGLPRKRYAGCLAGLAESARRNALAPGLLGARSALAARVEAILSSAPAPPVPGKLRTLAAAAAGSALCLGLLAAPSLVSFTPEAAAPETVAAAPVIFPAQARLRPASLVLPTPARTAASHVKRRRKRQVASRPLLVSAPQPPRILLLVPVVRALPAPVWTQIVFLTL